MAKLVGFSDDDLKSAGERLRNGQLVSFPTETVYGLGGNGLSQDAALKIFQVKGRPPTDPLILHIASIEDAAPLWAADEETLHVAMTLGRKFWPGPLTIVCTAAAAIPPAVTGGCGAVGVRFPDHDVAQRLIRAAGVPVAAPSANTFGHVSPTTARHVMEDLAIRDPTLTVVDGGACPVGIESTVVRIQRGSVEVLRRGKILPCALQQAVGPGVRVHVRDNRARHLSLNAPMDGPGQSLSHYCPSVPAFLVKEGHELASLVAAGGGEWVGVAADGGRYVGRKALVINFGGMLSALCEAALASFDLSASGDVEEGCRKVFEALRWCETVDKAEVVLVPMVTTWRGVDAATDNAEMFSALEDRLFRASSGNFITICSDKSSQ